MFRRGVVLVAVSIALGADAREVEVTLRPARADVRCEVTGFAGAAPLEHAVIVTEPVTLTVNADDLATELRAISVCWSDPVPLPATTASIDLWPVATVIGVLAQERGAKPPRELAGIFIDADAAAREHTAACALDDRTWRCSVPAGRPLHLRLTVGDFAPLYVRDIEARDSVFDTGIHLLIRGASVTGRVDPPVNATVTLLPLFSGHQPAADRNLAKLSTKTNEKGWFQFAGVPPGRYRITSRTQGRADAVSEIDVGSNQEVRLDTPLFHVPLSELEAILSPPVAPSGRPWNVILRRPAGRLQMMDRVGEGVVALNGVWTKAGLQPGAYLLTVIDGESEVAHELIELHGGAERIAIAVNTIEVRGRVTAAGRPLKATIQFHLIDAVGRRVQADTDDEGVFHVTFPVPGEWRPSVWIGSEVRLPPVEIRKAHDEDLELEIPGGRLSARVLDAGGKPAPAAVTVRRDGKTAAGGLTDDDGKLELFGLEGDYTVTAESEDGFAGPVPVSVPEDDVAEVELQVSALREVSGRIVSGDGSAASGAIVRALDDITRNYEETIADGRGMFRFRIKPDTQFVDVVVLAPPYPIAFRRIVVGVRHSTSAPQIVLAPAGATLRVPLTGSTPPWPAVTAPNGRAYSLALLLAPSFGASRFRELIDGAWQFNVEPGQYIVCTPKNECRSALLTANAETFINWAGTP